MLSANFKPKRIAAASRGFLAIARLSCFTVRYNKHVTVYMKQRLLIFVVTLFVVKRLRRAFVVVVFYRGMGEVRRRGHCREGVLSYTGVLSRGGGLSGSRTSTWTFV